MISQSFKSLRVSLNMDSDISSLCTFFIFSLYIWFDLQNKLHMVIKQNFRSNNFLNL